jgi:hypothetical protein
MKLASSISKYLKLSTFVFGLASFGSSHAFAIDVPLPCQDADRIATTVLRTCKDYLDGSSNDQSQLGKDGFNKLFKQQVQNQIDSFYQGKDLDTTRPDSPSFGPTFCQLVPGKPFVSKEEIKNDHNGKSCGNTHKVVVDYWASCNPMSPGGGITAINILNDEQSGEGTLEYGYLRGALGTVNAVYYNQLNEQINKGSSFSVDDGSSCADAAKDVKTLIERIKKPEMQKLDMKCEAGWDKMSKKRPDVGEDRQSAQYLCSARAAAEAAFLQVATCEVYSRAQKAYIKFAGTAEKQKKLFDKINKKSTDYCTPKCMCNPCMGGCSKVNECATECVKDKTRDLLEEMIKSEFSGKSGG